MSSAEATLGVNQLVERLLLDRGFRARFRSDPPAVAHQLGFDGLAEDLRGQDRGMETLEIKESKSSLAGVVMAVAAEAIGLVAVRSLLPEPRHDHRLYLTPLRQPLPGGARGVAAAADAPGTGHAGSSAAEPSAAAHSGTGQPVSHAGPPPTGHSGGPTGALSQGTGAGGAAGTALPSGTRSASAHAISELLSNPHLQMPAAARSALEAGNVDQRIVDVLSNVTAHHTVGLRSVATTTDPVHAQAVDIVSIDGEPVDSHNVSALEVVSEIAALDPQMRPNEIGTPWPIESPGFYSDPTYAARLHLEFTSPGDYSVSVASSGAGASVAVHASTPAPAGIGVAADAAGAGAAADPFYASPIAHAAYETAKRELGVPYVWGGTSPSGFDCSGLVQWAYKQVGISLPRVAADQFNVGTPVDLHHLREGDLVFFKDPSGYVHHVGMYVGNYKFIQAPRTGENVDYGDLRDPYFAQQFAGGRRIVPLSEEAPGLSPLPGAPLAADPPPQRGTAVFRALVKQERSYHRHTAMFLPAVKPPPTPEPAHSAERMVRPAGPGAGASVDLSSSGMAYPGDNASQPAIARWMGAIAQQHGIPPELPVMAALQESSLHNDQFGDRDSLGFFQMRTSIWDNGQYAGFPHDPALQMKWFIDHALAVRQAHPELAQDPSRYGEWIADIEQPAEQYRGLYQPHLAAAQQLLAGMTGSAV